MGNGGICRIIVYLYGLSFLVASFKSIKTCVNILFAVHFVLDIDFIIIIVSVLIVSEIYLVDPGYQSIRLLQSLVREESEMYPEYECSDRYQQYCYGKSLLG